MNVQLVFNKMGLLNKRETHILNLELTIYIYIYIIERLYEYSENICMCFRLCVTCNSMFLIVII